MARVRMPGLLDGELQEIARLRVRAGQFQLQADDTSQATLTIPEDGPVVGLRDWVSLYDEDGLMGVYRVTNLAQTVKRSVQLTLLHGIDILADSYWAEEREYTGSVRGYLEALLQQQTALIDGTAPWALGDCEDTETTLKVKISYGRLSELIREAVPEGGGYQLEYDQTVWPWRVHLRAKPTAAAAEFRVARNITSATVTYNDADLCTRLILSNTSGGESRVRVYSAGAIAQAEWGIVTKTASIDTSDTLTSESWPEAEAWVAEFFRQHAAPSVQIQIDGRELYRLTGDRWDRASLGRVCRVSLPEYGHVFEERVVSLTYPDPWGDPDRVVVSLANALPQFSEQVKLIEKTAQSASRAAGGAARKADQTAEELERKEVIYQTSFQKTDREIAGIASATGLQFNADGTPVLDEDGNFVYSEEHPDNALIAQISLQAGRYDRIIQATGISETPSQGEVSLVTQISQTHQQISNAAIATGLVWVPEDTTVDPPVPGHYEVDENAISSSVYKQLAGQIQQKVTASDVATQVEAYGYTTLTAARNAASAMIGADLKDANGVITSAKIKALVEGDTSLIQLVAQQVDVVAELASYSGDIELQGTLYSEGGFDTIGDSKFEGNLVIDGGDLDLVNGATLKVGGSTLGMVIDAQIVADGTNGYKLQKKMYGSTSWTDAGSFSRAASIQTVSGSWSGSTYTVAADASGTALPKSVTIDAILAGGGTADFSAQIRDTSSGQSPTIIDSNAAHGYLAKSGNSVIVYTSRSGSTYSGPVASLSFQSEINTAASNAKQTALNGVKLSGWQLNSSSHDAENIVRDADNNDLLTVSLPSNWDISVGAFNSSGSATITVRPVIGGSNGTQVATGTIADSNLKPENIKSGVTIFGKTGTYTGSGGSSDVGTPYIDPETPSYTFVETSSHPKGYYAVTPKVEVDGSVVSGSSVLIDAYDAWHQGYLDGTGGVVPEPNVTTALITSGWDSSKTSDSGTLSAGTTYAVRVNVDGTTYRYHKFTTPSSTSHSVEVDFNGYTPSDAVDKGTLDANTTYCVRGKCGSSYAYIKFKTPASSTGTVTTSITNNQSSAGSATPTAIQKGKFCKVEVKLNNSTVKTLWFYAQG